jgi:hypothetical protein
MLEQDAENTKASSFVVLLEATMRVCKWVDSIGLSMCLCLCLSAFLLPSFFLLYSLQDICDSWGLGNFDGFESVDLHL